MKDLKGTPNWYDNTTHSIEDMDGYIDDLQSFVGAVDGDTFPTYISIDNVTQNIDLETAIGQLDAYLGPIKTGFTGSNYLDGYDDAYEMLQQLDNVIAELDPIVTLQDAFNNSQTELETSPEINLGASVDLNIGGTGTSKLQVSATGGIDVTTGKLFNSTLNGSMYLSPDGDGYISADVPDGTATGGNARGINAVDFQMSRATAAQVASGNYSAVLGGLNNTASDNNAVALGGQGNTASSTSSAVLGGSGNTASGGSSAVLGGSGNTASGGSAVILGGLNNVASDVRAAILGGQSNQITAGDNSIILGGSSNSTSSASLTTIIGSTGITKTGGTGLFIGSSSESTGTNAAISIASSNNTWSGSGISLFSTNNNITGGTVIGGSVNTVSNSGRTIFSSNSTASNSGIALGGSYNSASDNGIVMGRGGLVADLGSLAIANNGSAVASAAINNHFYISGNTSDVVIGRYVDQPLVSGATNQIRFQTIEASNQSKSVALSAPTSGLTSHNLYLPKDQADLPGSPVFDAYQVLANDGLGQMYWIDNPSTTITLQQAYDNGSAAEPDIVLETGLPFSIVASDGEPTMTISDAYFRVWDSADGSPSFEVTESQVTILGGAAAGDPIVEVTADYFKVFTTGTADGPTLMVNTTSGDGYVWIDGYLAVTGSTFQVETQITDADHWLITPISPSQPALIIAPESTGFDGYYIGVQDASGVDGYTFFVEEDSTLTRVGIVGDNVSFKYADGSEEDGYFLKSDASGNAVWFSVADQLAGAGLSSTGTVLSVNVVPGETIIDGDAVGLDEAFSKVNFTSFSMGSASDMTFDAQGNTIILKTDGYAASLDGYVLMAAANGTGEAAWEQLTAASLYVNDTFYSTPSSGSQTLQNVLTEMDAYMVDAYMQIDLTQGSIGSAIDGEGAWVGFSGTNLLDTSLSITDALDLLDDGYGSLQAEIAALDITAGYGLIGTGSLQAGTLTFDVVGVANEIDVFADSVGVAANFIKTFTNFDAYMSSDGYLMATGSGSDLTLGSEDGYAYFRDLHLTADGYTSGVALSTNLLMPAGGWSDAIIAAAGGTSIADIGIIDAINAAASLGGGKVEKAVYVIAPADGRLTGISPLSDNVLDISAAADRGSIDLVSVGLGHKMERDVEVFVNGVLQLADDTQGDGSTLASDDYYIADTNASIVFSFDLVAGDVVTVVNRKADSVEDVDTGWNY
jgi:hypothetical protein